MAVRISGVFWIFFAEEIFVDKMQERARHSLAVSMQSQLFLTY